MLSNIVMVVMNLMNKLQQETENDDNCYNSILLLSTKKTDEYFIERTYICRVQKGSSIIKTQSEVMV